MSDSCNGVGRLDQTCLRRERRIEQERPARHQRLDHIISLEKHGLMARDEIGAGHQIRGTDRLRPEAQVGNRHRAGFLGVINEVALRVIIRAFADDLDGILICADRAVRAQAVKHCANHVVGFGREIGVHREAGLRDIVVDADGEMVFRFCLREIVENRFDHGRGELLGGKPVTAAINARQGRDAAPTVP